VTSAHGPVTWQPRGMSAPDTPQAGGRLVVCGTPIGNLGDAPPRLASALAEADVVACEDTREAAKLLSHLGVRVRTVSYHDGNERARAAELAEAVASGQRVALISDAGMPAISDPGHHLIQACVARGLPVEVVPGPSAVLVALVLSGLPSEGFLPRKAGPRDRRLAELAAEPRTMVFFEAPHRVLATLAAMAKAFGPERPAAITRELTKLHEQVLRGTMAELHERLAEQGPRGEFTLVVAGAPEPESPDSSELATEVARLVAEGASTRDAVDSVARASGAPRRELYQAVLGARSRGGRSSR
jgi:16S rRNA (cytidine1402-2'-O)-methyltransferase